MCHYRPLPTAVLGLLLTALVAPAAAQPVPVPAGAASKMDRLAQRDRPAAASFRLAAAGKSEGALAAAEEALAIERELSGPVLPRRSAAAPGSALLWCATGR
jgi:hypothetical protein